ncbi:unnamed protein product [Mycena citricolor]|uniref:G-patch domain-containing protein n=1 Tax=Mycena citricolor TaxID=2018698 RepID=A0AAD2HED9_9AGAR|nr:unnamed protein product [Mycena citricolor]CAK5273675.1 unnamed protein product [Mycena citricolor]
MDGTGPGNLEIQVRLATTPSNNLTMTSRLKKKLGNLGIDPASARANESFCLIGTPLPPLEKSRDTGEFVPLWKQEVRDEKGRRRLHGAFTGGFSAGYFNTVGSKEGWAPSTFVSSRADRSKKKVASRPEDFMDDEDLQDIKDSRNIVDTTEEMDLTAGSGLSRGDDKEQDSVAHALESSMLPAAKDSAGARILKKMGWKIGQGIGPRITLRQRRLQDLQAAGRRDVTEAELGLPDDHAEADKHTYAPRDTAVLVVDRKDNLHGLGYRPGMSLNESTSSATGAKVGPNISAGFGLGALNDADEDDLDVYDGGNTTQGRNRTAYDIIDREEEDKISIGTKRDASRPAPPVVPSQVFPDGQPVLAGFVLSDKPVSEDRWFPMPEIPQGWKPDPRRVWDKENSNHTASAPPPLDKRARDSITADQRGAILGETPLPSAPRSVFDYMSQKDRDRIQNMSKTDAEAPGPSLPPPPASIVIPRTEPHIALAALQGGFVPFATNADKQARYTTYLESQTGSDSAPAAPKLLPHQPIDEYNKELEDYAKAALLFKPLSGAMAGRFQSASVVEHGPQMKEGLYTPTAEDHARKEAEVRKMAEERVTPKQNAARHGMYGPMTRESVPWQPARLLCKRFKVKDPNPAPAEDESSAAEPGAATSAGGGAWEQFSSAAAAGSSSAGTSGSGSRGPRDLANIGLGEDESQGRDTLTYQRPAMDVFKAIFASDDEDSDDEEPAKDPEPDPEPMAVDEPKLADEDVSMPEAAAPPPTVPPAEEGPVDLATFKPTFIPRDGKGKKAADGTQDTDKKRDSRKRDRKERTNRVLVSFEDDDDGAAGGLQITPKEKPSKKKRRKEKRKDAAEDVDDDAMWVEKPVPAVVQARAASPSLDVNVGGSVAPNPEILPKGRKRAIDFM